MPILHPTYLLPRHGRSIRTLTARTVSWVAKVGIHGWCRKEAFNYFIIIAHYIYVMNNGRFFLIIINATLKISSLIGGFHLSPDLSKDHCTPNVVLSCLTVTPQCMSLLFILMGNLIYLNIRSLHFCRPSGQWTLALNGYHTK